jgi:hypothetical protein
MKGSFLAGFALLGLLLLLAPQTGLSAGRALAGKVTRFDPSSRILSIRSNGGTVTFDVSGAVLRGYRAVQDIRKGDTVEVTYTSTGVRIVRCSEGRNAVAGKGPRRSRDGKHAKTVGRLQRRQPKGDGLKFEDSDVNKDGKISPVELSVVIPDITMIRFRGYDTDHDGCLNRSEFTKAMGR